MNTPVRNIVIVGGGSAGWLTAGLLAAEYAPDKSIQITLIESDNIAHIGVGEGTWPSMRSTLERIGISETQFLNCCNASFKQGSLFRKWRNGADNDAYHHPFTVPGASNELDLAAYWFAHHDKIDFAYAASAQPLQIERGRAPKQISTPEYAFVNNYGYHLDAGKFVTLLQSHCQEQLHVRRIVDDVTGVNGPIDGAITSVSTQHHGEVSGDLFIDCTGFSSLLLAQHYGIEFKSQKHILFNDRALAVQVPYPDEDSPIASATLSTAQKAGWIWDIGLQTRRGVGYVYSSAHSSPEDAALELAAYVGADVEHLDIRTIGINPGYREKFWHHNCVAIGMSAGFIEPLEASALVMIELGAKFIAEQLPATSADMALVSERYNQTFSYRWQHLIEFLKLHYVLSQRDDSDYWRDNRHTDSIPASLQERLAHWQNKIPSRYDLPYAEELFPAASYQYILYGMNSLPTLRTTTSWHKNQQKAQHEFARIRATSEKMLGALESNRALLDKIRAHGLNKI
ncbi:tryptophan halogenase family protein [Pseudoalteromonas sp. SSDWG2]|uniref:tryptophan halogenase family protein n=1 Tax=Pseudoalteromonas sp. SSDWG2 TaxID=3139391 RepID=UPI003BA88751